MSELAEKVDGLENIFLSIARGLDQQVPTGSHWHRDLLVQMTQETAKRGGVISAELARKLADYLGFRHSIGTCIRSS